MPAPTNYQVIRQQLSDTGATRIEAPQGKSVVSAVVGRNFNNELLQPGNDFVVRTYFYDGAGKVTGVEFGTNSSSELDGIVICVGS